MEGVSERELWSVDDDSMKAHWSVSGISSQPVSTGSSATAQALQSTTNPRNPHGQYRRRGDGDMKVVSLGPSNGTRT